MKICLTCSKEFDSETWHCPYCDSLPIEISGFPALAPELASSSTGFRPEYFSQLANLEASNFWFRSRNKLILMLLKKYCPDMNSFIEIGCGTGFVLSGIARTFPESHLTGSEIYSNGLEYAADRIQGAQFIQMDAQNIPFESHFDAIGTFDVLEHIEQDELVVSQLNKALKPGGILLITVPQHPELWSLQDEMACHVRRYTATELKQKVRDAGFEILDMGSFVSLLLPVMWWSRRMGKKVKKEEYNPMKELSIGKLPNLILGAIMCIEIGCMRLGFRFPAGGSLFLIARKRN
ncbi:MAG: class I SAM-dependent methyltransferase [Gallionella sp.]